jgi:hypothetical protein
VATVIGYKHQTDASASGADDKLSAQLSSPPLLAKLVVSLLPLSFPRRREQAKLGRAWGRTR